MGATPQPPAPLWERPHSPQRRYRGDPVGHSAAKGATPQCRYGSDPTEPLWGQPHSSQHHYGGDPTAHSVAKGATPQRCYRGDPTAHSPAMEATPQPTASLWGRPHSPQRRYGGDPTAHSITMGATPQPTASLRGRPHSPQRRVGRPQPPPPQSPLGDPAGSARLPWGAQLPPHGSHRSADRGTQSPALGHGGVGRC